MKEINHLFIRTVKITDLYYNILIKVLIYRNRTRSHSPGKRDLWASAGPDQLV